MPTFSAQSQERLKQCHPELIRLFNEVIKNMDCTILCGFRPQDEQEEAVRTGKSKEHWPNSKHNKFPSLAVDVAPSPIDWNDKIKFYYFIGYVLGTAQQMGIKIRSGSDWSMDHNLKNQTFFDLPHFELVP